MQFNTDVVPSVSGLYFVDRGIQGKWYRYFHADTQDWGICCPEMDEAYLKRDIRSNVEFAPWVGPLTGPKYKPGVQVETEVTVNKLVKVASDEAVEVKTVVAPKTKKKEKVKVTVSDGTVFYREDRQMWVAVYNGKQEAARPTAEKCLAFLKKKYNIEGAVTK